MPPQAPRALTFRNPPETSAGDAIPKDRDFSRTVSGARNQREDRDRRQLRALPLQPRDRRLGRAQPADPALLYPVGLDAAVVVHRRLSRSREMALRLFTLQLPLVSPFIFWPRAEPLAEAGRRRRIPPAER